MMKPVSNIRKGLAQIPGALNELPPNPGYEGSEEAVHSHRTRTIWQGESPDLRPGFSNDTEDGFLEDGADDSVFGVDSSGSSFDPVFEIGAEMDEQLPGLGGAEGRKIQQSVQLHGMDALAWYVSFHHPGLQWGIYIPISGLAYLMKNAFGGLNTSATTKAHLAFHAALNHELFHFATDYAIAQVELEHQEPWYLPSTQATRQKDPPYREEEEALANAYMLKAFRSSKPSLRVKGKQAALRAFVAKQPEGYRDALDIRPSHWASRLESLAWCYGVHSAKNAEHPALWSPGTIHRQGYDWPARFPIYPHIDWRYCPIHLVDDSQRYGLPADWLSFFSRLPEINETDDFRKKLKKLSPPIQKAWNRTKQKLGTAITSGADFKKWTKGGSGLFSVRVNANFRAHLQRRNESDEWLAVAIGNHKEMGHG